MGFALNPCRVGLIVALLSAVCSFGRTAPLAGAEYALKAAFIYNFAMFTTWAEKSDKTLILCIFGRDPFGPAIDVLEGKEIGNAKLSIRRLRSGGEASQACQIAYISEAEVDNYLDHVGALRDGSGVLTISEKEGSARQGIIIELTSEDKKIGFEFNREAARLNNVQISSKLLRIARKVY
ncbi:YfiR family protein [Janthinobacterium sp.]|uniref:YfiR family protein n=1 Tax=Janthinobacterium sp. TaxID=1871054 RepID=UPI00293D798A|nr:YfiR family protein [Janthinobacterium sp.]